MDTPSFAELYKTQDTSDIQPAKHQKKKTFHQCTLTCYRVHRKYIAQTQENNNNHAIKYKEKKTAM